MINSRHNPLVQHARLVRDGKVPDVILIEGIRLGEEAARAQLAIGDVLHTLDFAEDTRGAELLAALRRNGARLSIVGASVLASVADTKSPPGVVILARRPPTERATLESRLSRAPVVVVLHRINNPANAGAMLRVAEAAGAQGVIATRGTTDLLAPKALRGAMGSAFRLPLWTNADYADVLRWCAARGLRSVATDLGAGQSYTEVDWTQAHAIICGAEADGLTAAESEAADLRIHIPMRAPVESLNVAVALGVILYEAARQRSLSKHGKL